MRHAIDHGRQKLASASEARADTRPTFVFWRSNLLICSSDRHSSLWDGSHRLCILATMHCSSPLLGYEPCRACPPGQGWINNADFEGDNTTLTNGGDSNRTMGVDPGFVTSAQNATVGLNFTGESESERVAAPSSSAPPAFLASRSDVRRRRRRRRVCEIWSSMVATLLANIPDYCREGADTLYHVLCGTNTSFLFRHPQTRPCVPETPHPTLISLVP